MARNESKQHDVEDAEATEAEAETEVKKAKRQKDPMPEGFGTPVDFTKVLLEKRGVTVRPQVIFGYVKNSKTFQEFTDFHTDGRTRVNLDLALLWYDEKEERKTAKEAEKASKPA